MHENIVQYKTYLVEITHSEVKINVLLFFAILESRTEKARICMCLFTTRTKHYFNRDSRII